MIGLTGTPGTGKTTIAKILEQKNVHILYLKELAETHNFIDSYDKNRESNIIDLDAVEDYLDSTYCSDQSIIIESHLSHLLQNVNQVIVLRCHPKIIRDRLLNRKWTWKKIRENIEAEILDIILCEAVDQHGEQNVNEIDTTRISCEEIAHDILNKLLGKPTEHLLEPGSFDWSELLIDSSLLEEKIDGS